MIQHHQLQKQALLCVSDIVNRNHGPAPSPLVWCRLIHRYIGHQAGPCQAIKVWHTLAQQALLLKAMELFAKRMPHSSKPHTWAMSLELADQLVGGIGARWVGRHPQTHLQGVLCRGRMRNTESRAEGHASQEALCRGKDTEQKG
eukprot:1159744-Pelagomonas_calceolata.AAC.9